MDTLLIRLWRRADFRQREQGRALLKEPEGLWRQQYALKQAISMVSLPRHGFRNAVAHERSASSFSGASLTPASEEVFVDDFLAKNPMFLAALDKMPVSLSSVERVPEGSAK